MQKAMDTIGYRQLREEQKAKQEAFKRGETREIMGIGISFFTEIVGAGPSKNCDILGVAMFDSAEIRVHPTGSVISRMGTKARVRAMRRPGPRSSQPKSAFPADDIMVEEGNTDTAPYGLGTYGSRSTPVAGAAIALAARKIRNKAQMIAAHMLEVSEYDLEWDVDGFQVKGNPQSAQVHEGNRLGGLQRAAAEPGTGSGGCQLLRPAEHDLSVWRVLLCHGHRRRHGRCQDTAVLRAGRLRHPHQPDDHRGAGAWRFDRGLRHRDGSGDPPTTKWAML
jgi:CO/xanthine dehydrogenase Mo-binding subunit